MEHKDYDNLVRARDQFQSIATLINESKRNAEKLEEIKKNMRTNPRLPHRNAPQHLWPCPHQIWRTHTRKNQPKFRQQQQTFCRSPHQLFRSFRSDR